MESELEFIGRIYLQKQPANDRVMVDEMMLAGSTGWYFHILSTATKNTGDSLFLSLHCLWLSFGEH